uniref:DNA replication complex GINS protein PSF2 n=1 Tax=Mantoniella antarctica TaxID=81844 RepID=A0A7S0X995_9CHLO|mmetsp:Transcript_2377/g.5693  ORF Transcript_2377/g.5693 Transcript_2377/m.5693 type:complete len:184 (+) Transcript_2377:210-761(+)|eukprot:CAMPEP_0181373732 /NCGR_PEP_ID=MMETSP1106-20121128/15568_1 /TAXON_ID=81844 /ORGANISM="Mantoniella antarctica, Strain SL-175" /LENGTH=183 /DNA_ID=CAMNT_0023491515 /DNA_START=128 /DNA_END=679 /DNA_ORIENTATION=+
MVNNALEELTHQEVHFVAEDEEIVVVPNFSLPPVHMLGGTYGPFRPQIPVGVPLWLAMILKKQGKCNVIPPRWLDVATLNSVIELERNSDEVFQALPFHYIELATDLCKYAREDLQDWSLSYDLLDSIRAIRLNKIQAGLRTLSSDALKGIKIGNLSAMEVNIIRPFMSTALNHFLDANGNAL